MDISTLWPLLLTGASTGLTCGISCGACGNPMTNVFLAGYLFTHSGQMKKSLMAFAGYHTGKAMTVSALCVLVSWFGSQIVNENGELFGLDLTRIVNVVMLLFVIWLLIRWTLEGRRNSAARHCSGKCRNRAPEKNGFAHMLFYGMICGISPCASLLMILSYTAALNTAEAILVGLCFSAANALIPLLLLTVLTGVLSEQMHRELPAKVRYFQLAVYVLYACVLVKNILY